MLTLDNSGSDVRLTMVLMLRYGTVLSGKTSKTLRTHARTHARATPFLGALVYSAPPHTHTHTHTTRDRYPLFNKYTSLFCTIRSH